MILEIERESGKDAIVMSKVESYHMFKEPSGDVKFNICFGGENFIGVVNPTTESGEPLTIDNFTMAIVDNYVVWRIKENIPVHNKAPQMQQVPQMQPPPINGRCSSRLGKITRPFGLTGDR